MASHALTEAARLRSENHLNVALQAGGEVVAVHRAVVSACSPFLRGMLTAGMREAADKARIRVDELQSTDGRRLSCTRWTPLRCDSSSSTCTRVRICITMTRFTRHRDD